ncbi:MAG: phosphotransferase family protein, partial [Gammaproteobacteria bacterium]|nr:phosphotransferase family protein [Gammaproteobacteria bacterium]
MSTGEKNVIGAIAALGVWPQKKFMVQQRLGDGPTNETWLVTCEQEHYVLRLVKPFAVSVGLSLKDELHITLAAQQRNLAPEVVASCVTSGIVLSRYVQGRPWTAGDLQNKQQLDLLANRLRQLHGLDCKARLLDLRAVLQDYAQRSTDARAGTWRDSALARLDEIDPREHTVCHNDLTAANIIDNGTLCFIDWEYA